MKLLWQIGILFGVCFAGEGIAKLLPVPFPASVIAMILLFILLISNKRNESRLGESADFFMQNMSFLFIPSGVGIIQVFDSIKGSLLPLVTICIVSTVLTFAVTAYTVSGVIKLQEAIAARRKV
ncbi:MAG: CidA/LrgA family protein [Clostridiales bacterium]|jgi:holin-like protein|nr:CidA/LrgA family protein [Clostridiales bacterium]